MLESDTEQRRRDLSERYLDVRSLTEALAAPLSAEDQTVQSMPDVSPTKWHRAHTTWFFETFLLAARPAGLPSPSIPAYALPLQLLLRGRRRPATPVPTAGWCPGPGVTEVAAYRRHVDAAMGDAARRPGSATRRPPTCVELGIHHEQQHQELLLMDIKHVLSCNPLAPGLRRRRPPAARRPAAPPSRWIEHPTAASSRSATTGAASPSTTRVPATRSTSAPSPWPTGR